MSRLLSGSVRPLDFEGGAVRLGTVPDTDNFLERPAAQKGTASRDEWNGRLRR
jgi:hypothetical protein